MIVTEVTGGDAVRQYLDGFANRLNARLLGVMAILGTQLQDRVRDKLGGAVLQRRSGRLAAGISFEVEATDGTTTVILGAGDVPYAGYQEYGFHGTETVRAHLRTIRHAFGRSIRPRAIEVHTYTRQVNYPAHSFLRAALAEIAPDVPARIEDAVAEEAGA